MTAKSRSSSVRSAGQPSKTIGLCMIVKNEAHVITRCLESVKPLVDYVLIEDTGSTDGTQEIIREWLARENIAGEVIEEPWRNFAFNRSHVMERLREVSDVDYAFIIDADDKLVLEPDFDPSAYKRDMRHDLYDVEIRHGDSRFHRPQICSNHMPFCFKAVLHEYLEAPPGPVERATAEGFHVETGRGGARNKNPRKYEDDAAALEQALLTETDPFLISRYTFYLAQSYRDCGEKEKSLQNYLKRADMGFWAEEVFESLYAAAKLKEELDHPEEEVLAAYARATDAVPTRAEALHGAAKFCRLKGRNEEGYQLARRGAEIPMPASGLFLSSWIYQWGLLDELAINAYWAGHGRASLDACLRLLQEGHLPEDQRPRILQNARFALDKLPAEPNLGSAGQEGLTQQHAIVAERPLRSRVKGAPRVLLAILAKQKEEMLPLYLECIEALDYPKSSIVLYVRTNNNTDGTERILREWIGRVGHLYADVEFDASDVSEQVQEFAAHEWNATRFRVLGHIRNISLRRTLEAGCDYYFVADVDNFIRPGVLRDLVALDLPVVAPLLRSLRPGAFYSNYHAEVDANGYYAGCDQYMWILNRWVRGVVEVPVVHTTYLVRADVIPELSYLDDTDRYEYVIFSDTARKANVIQHLDNRQVYGYIAFGKGSEHYVEGGIEQARALLATELEASARGGTGEGLPVASPPARPRVFACFGQHGSGSTWLYNLVRQVCEAAAIPHVSVHRDSAANLPWDEPGSPVIIAKTHNPMADFQAYVARTTGPVSITVRDPRDCVVSLMQRFPTTTASSFEQALDAIALSAERLEEICRLREVAVFRYEDGFVGSEETVDRIAALLGVALPADRKAALLAALTPEAVRRKIGRLEASGAIQGEQVWDKQTHWHVNHVGDGKVGKWRDVLTDEQAREILARTRAYCERFGYWSGPAQAEPTAAAERTVAPSAKRYVRLKEFPPSSEVFNTPTADYLAARDSTLVPATYKITTDADGFILPASGGAAHGRRIIILGDSVVEGMFANPEDRFCSRLEEKLRAELGEAITVLNAGYSGATSLHSFNVFLNKIIPLKPDAVILMTGIVDVDVAHLEKSFWSRDCWIEPIIDVGVANSWRDGQTRPAPSFDDRERMLAMFTRASELFGVPLWYATVPHRQEFSGEYVAKAFKDRAEFDRQVRVRKEMNEATRRAATAAGQPLFDLEAELAGRSDIFYDMFHANPAGGEAVADAFMAQGLARAMGSGRPATAPITGGAALRRPSALELDEVGEIHLINLDRSVERLARFHDRNPHLQRVTRISAVDGRLVDRRQLVADGVITESLPYEAGALGCAMSHIGLWRKAVREHRRITIFEDDAVSSDHFYEETRRVLSEIPENWDLVQWGYIYNPLFIWVDLGVAKARLRFYDDRYQGRSDQFQRDRNPPRPLKLAHSFGTQAYSVSPRGAQALLDQLLPLSGKLVTFPGAGVTNEDSGIDVAMCACYESMKAFICVPPLIVQDDQIVSDRMVTNKNQVDA